MVIDLRQESLNVTIDRFPDGQVNVHLGELNRKEDSMDIITSLRSADDIMLLLQTADVLKRNGMIIDDLTITYLYAARMDRVMTFDQPYTLKIVADLINSVGANHVCVVLPHNLNKTLNLINHCGTINPLNEYNFSREGLTIVYPDAGAKNRFAKGFPCVCCSKHRDPKDNSLSGFKIESGEIFKDTEVIRIIDDLCDGGGTFIGIKAMLDKECKTIGIKPKFELVVTHLIQEYAINRLLDAGFDRIITTDSFRDWRAPYGSEKFVVEDCTSIASRRG